MANPWLLLRIGYWVGRPDGPDTTKAPPGFRHRDSETAAHRLCVGSSNIVSIYQYIELNNIEFTRTS